MTLSTLINRPCQIVTRTADGTRNAYNDEIVAETIVETVCELQQRQRGEDTDAGDIADSSWLLVLPAGTQVAQDSTVIVDGDRYELDGEPWPARNPRTQLMSHIEATVRRTTAPDDSDPAS